MGAFNRLSAQVCCKRCNQHYPAVIQFKFGDTWQYEYRICDTLKWDGNDIGEPNLTMVKVYGIAEKENCPFCNHSNPEFDIIIKKDVITEVVAMKAFDGYEDTDDGFYIVL